MHSYGDGCMKLHAVYQEIDDEEHVISSMNSEMTYPAHTPELLTLFWTMTKTFYDYLQWHRFTVTRDK